MHLPCCSGPHEITDCREGVLDTDDFRLPAIRTYLGLGFMADVVEADPYVSYAERDRAGRVRPAVSQAARDLRSRP